MVPVEESGPHIAVGGTGVSVGVAVGGTGVSVGVAVGGIGVSVGVAVGGIGVGVTVFVGVGGIGVGVLVGVGGPVTVNPSPPSVPLVMSLPPLGRGKFSAFSQLAGLAMAVANCAGVPLVVPV